MTEAKVSVIIPCYNYGRFLEDSVNSVIAQTHANWECLIIDDGSPDNTAVVALKLAESDPRVKYFHKINGGLSSARNHGIEKAQGDFICFLDADDVLDKRKLELQLAAFKHDPSADIVYGKAMFFKNDLSELYTGKNNAGPSELSGVSGKGKKMLSVLNRKNITVVSAPLMKRDVFSTAGNFDVNYKSYEDWHFWIRCALAGCRFLYSSQPEVCTYIRFGHESMMSDTKKMLRAGIQLRKFMATKLPQDLRFYNSYRLLRSQIKLLLTK